MPRPAPGGSPGAFPEQLAPACPEPSRRGVDRRRSPRLDSSDPEGSESPDKYRQTLGSLLKRTTWSAQSRSYAYVCPRRRRRPCSVSDRLDEGSCQTHPRVKPLPSGSYLGERISNGRELPGGNSPRSLGGSGPSRQGARLATPSSPRPPSAALDRGSADLLGQGPVADLQTPLKFGSDAGSGVRESGVSGLGAGLVWMPPVLSVKLRLDPSSVWIPPWGVAEKRSSRGVLLMGDVHLIARLAICARCLALFSICLECDRGRGYCGNVCSSAARRESLRRARARYRASARGRCTA